TGGIDLGLADGTRHESPCGTGGERWPMLRQTAHERRNPAKRKKAKDWCAADEMKAMACRLRHRVPPRARLSPDVCYWQAAVAGSPFLRPLSGECGYRPSFTRVVCQKRKMGRGIGWRAAGRRGIVQADAAPHRISLMWLAPDPFCGLRPHGARLALERDRHAAHLGALRL